MLLTGLGWMLFLCAGSGLLSRPTPTTKAGWRMKGPPDDALRAVVGGAAVKPTD